MERLRDQAGTHRLSSLHAPMGVAAQSSPHVGQVDNFVSHRAPPRRDRASGKLIMMTQNIAAENQEADGGMIIRAANSAEGQLN